MHIIDNNNHSNDSADARGYSFCGMVPKMISSSPEIFAYIRDCDKKDRDIQRISQRVEMSVCTCVSLMQQKRQDP